MSCPLHSRLHRAIFRPSKTSALAALAVVSAASAQTSALTIGGYIDRGYVVTNNTNNLKDAKAVSSNAGTTTVGITGTEDLGGGLSAGFSVNTDWSEAGAQTQDGTAPTAAQTAFGAGQSFLDLASKQFGTLRLGNPNSEVLTAMTSVASPAFSTGVGSAYSSSFSIHNGYGTGTTGSNNIFAASAVSSNATVGQRQIRQANTIKYISPNFMGFSAAFSTVRKNDTGGTADIAGVTEFALNYANGPLAVVYAQTKVETGANASTYANGALANNASSTMSILGASYQLLPVLKLHAGMGRSTASATAIAYDTNSYQVGATYNVTPVITVMAQYAKVDDKNVATNNDRTLTGLGADYNFSKTTRAYVRYDSINYNSNGTAAAGSQLKRTAVGVSKSF